MVSFQVKKRLNLISMILDSRKMMKNKRSQHRQLDIRKYFVTPKAI